MKTETILLNDKEIYKIIGRKIKFFRQLKGLSQSNLAANLGVTHQQLQKYETGKNCIPIHRLVKLTEVLHIDFNTFFENSININFDSINSQIKNNK